MKKVLVVLSLFVAMTFLSASAEAQTIPRTNVGQLVSGLINVNVGAVVVNDVVDVEDVLNNNDIDILNNVLNNSPILSNNSEILTNVLQNANILTGTQVVVGVLSGGIIVVQDTAAQ